MVLARLRRPHLQLVQAVELRPLASGSGSDQEKGCVPLWDPESSHSREYSVLPSRMGCARSAGNGLSPIVLETQNAGPVSQNFSRFLVSKTLCECCAPGPRLKVMLYWATFQNRREALVTLAQVAAGGPLAALPAAGARHLRVPQMRGPGKGWALDKLIFGFEVLCLDLKLRISCASNFSPVRSN